MASEKPKREDQIDERYADRFNPSQLSNAEQSIGDEYGLSSRQQKTLDNKLDRAGKQLENYTPEGNIDDVRQQEAALTSGLYTGSGRPEKKETVSLKGVFKKKGPLAALITLGLGIPTFLSILLSPALLIQQLAETMTNEFNDQLAALDARSTLLLKKKLNTEITGGVCGTKVSIKCKYRTIRANSGLAKRLEKAGITIDVDSKKSVVPGRIKPQKFIFEGKDIAAKDLLNEARRNPALRAALRKGYSPLYAAFSDKISTKVRDKVGIKRSSSVNSSTDKNSMNEDLKKVASEGEDLPREKLKPIYNDDGEISHYLDEDGNEVDKDDGRRINNLIDEINARDEIADSITEGASKAGIRSALTATSLGLGTADTLCTAWVVLRVASFAAKVYQQRQLIRYSYEFVKTAHMQKYGDLTPELMEFFGNKLTAINTAGKAALDSSGYKFAAYGDVFKAGDFNAKKISDLDSPEADAEAERILLQNETSRYVNGQLLNDNIMSTLVGYITKGGASTVEKADDICGFVKSWKGQAIIIGAALVGAVVAFFSGGTSLGLGAIANGAAAVAVSVAFALIQPKLLDMVKGEVIKGDENGNETGNAIASGMGGYNAHTAPGRGLGVAPQSTYTEYASLTEQVLAKNAEIDRSEMSPFDASSKNTFLGSIVSNILPQATKVSSLGSATLSASSLIGSSFASLGFRQSVSAANESEKYNQCDDHEYEGLAADPYCNLRYAIPKADLEIDPDKVLDYMLSKYDLVFDSEGNPVIDPETGEQEKIYHWIESPSDATPKGDYAEYIEKCFNREDSIGDPSSEEGDGEECIIGKGKDEKRNQMFRLFYLDQSVAGDDGGMDQDFESGTTAASGEGEPFTAGTYNLLHAGSHPGTSVDVAGGCDQSADPQCVNKRTSYQAKLILGEDKYQQIDIVGTQETPVEQYKKLLEKLPGYEGVPSTKEGMNKMNNSGKGNGNLSIIWNTAKFSKFDEGTVDAISNVARGPSQGHITAPWVGLEDSDGNKVYAISVHWPTSTYTNPRLGNIGTLKEGVKKLMKWVDDKSSDGTVLVMGDFNDAPPEKTTYCGITESGVMQNAYDMAKGENPSKPCPNTKTNFGIDHIYVSTGSELTAKKYQKFPDSASEAVARGSDHVPVAVELSYPGKVGESGSAVNSGDVTLPLAGTWYNSIRLDFLNSHGSTGTAWGGDNMGTSGKGPYIAADIGVPTGTPVYAMVGGTVTSTNLCGSKDGIAIKSNIAGKTLGIAYMHGVNKKFSVGDTIEAGDHIMDVGTIGCNVSGAHLHVGMAYGGSYICPQDVFIAAASNSSVNWQKLPSKTSRGCGRI